MSEKYTKAYLHHLFKTEEILGYRIATQHNLRFYIHIMKTMQEEIKSENFKNWAKGFLERYEGNKIIA
jgi:queuine tRNA-ribosyltransferase